MKKEDIIKDDIINIDNLKNLITNIYISGEQNKIGDSFFLLDSYLVKNQIPTKELLEKFFLDFEKKPVIASLVNFKFW